MATSYKQNICTIYKIICLINNKIYIGQTWYNHIWYFTNKHRNKKCIYLYNAFLKHGKENFKIEVLTFCATQETANNLETNFINLFDSCNSAKGYNIKDEGTPGKLAEETKRKISASHMGIGKGERRSINTEFKPGQIPWNAGTTGIMKPTNPIKKGEHRGLQTEFKKGQIPWNKKLTIKDEKDIILKFLAGQNRNSIAKEYGVPHCSITYVVKDLMDKK